MEIATAYADVSRLFDAWVRLMEKLWFPPGEHSRPLLSRGLP